MIQQQKSGRPLPAEFRHILSTYGALKPLKGFSATVLRESLYASGYLAVAPLLREALQQQAVVADLPGGPLIVSGVAAGLLATVCTQPADTIKTRMQAGCRWTGEVQAPRLLAFAGWELLGSMHTFQGAWGPLPPASAALTCRYPPLVTCRVACRHSPTRQHIHSIAHCCPPHSTSSKPRAWAPCLPGCGRAPSASSAQARRQLSTCPLVSQSLGAAVSISPGINCAAPASTMPVQCSSSTARGTR